MSNDKPGCSCRPNLTTDEAVILLAPDNQVLAYSAKDCPFHGIRWLDSAVPEPPEAKNAEAEETSL